MSRFKLVFSEAVRSIAANLSTSIAATMTVLIGMFLLGLFIALGSWVVSWSDHVKSELQIKVYFVDDVTPKQVNAVGDLPRHGHADQRVPLRLEGRGAQGDAQEVSRADRRTSPSNPLPGVVRGHAARTPTTLKVISADIRAAEVRRRRDGQGRAADSRSASSGRARDRARLPDRGARAPRGLRAADREHDPALDLLAPTRDRGDEARRRDELVRARSVHARGPAVRARRRVRGGRAARCSARRPSLPAIIPIDYDLADVQALVVPDHRAASCSRIGLGGRSARLRHDAAPLPEGLAPARRGEASASPA